ncbi:hypothetical protein [Bradyrhizobium sp. NP1]|uniref:hypothetical protein n=1 Tax=Bradyrhizobium sp. NP1 TaxID=3049772 RepID=UPI0025A571C5|nr:hypothetical protein [Bradyrhizobium sp. NP1]WJR75570.1 hypothetical protein QOU61_22530 [Bradyrhizobium sp. NP1]
MKIRASAGLCMRFPSVSGVVTTETDVERFRREAKECQQLAERATSPIDQEAWLRLEDDWIKLAEEAEKRRPAGA